jgi:K+-sensing histidine kinase KdpD
VDFPKNYVPGESQLINFRGPRGTVRTINFQDLLAGRVDKNQMRGALVLIGASGLSGHDYETPIGPMSRAEITANFLDNILAQRWVKPVPVLFVVGFLLILTAATAWLTTRYPQVVSAVLLITLLTTLIALSLSLFDLFNLYIPILPQALAVLVTYVIFTSFQLSMREYEKDQLEKEKAFILDVEELKSNFLSLISHDLKTPIAKIQGVCDRMSAKVQDADLAEDIQALRQEAQELNRYIKTLLQVTKAETRDFHLKKDPMDLNEITEAVCEQLAPLAQSRQIRLEFELEPMFLIEADALLIHEVILNLVENAIKFSPENSSILIRTRDVDGQVMFMVEDSGPGISEAEQPQIFQKFYRGQTGKEHARGSGLGLYLVKYFIERHDGSVILDSQPGRGTRIGFTLPIQDAEPGLNAETGERYEAIT